MPLQKTTKWTYKYKNILVTVGSHYADECNTVYSLISQARKIQKNLSKVCMFFTKKIYSGSEIIYFCMYCLYEYVSTITSYFVWCETLWWSWTSCWYEILRMQSLAWLWEFRQCTVMHHDGIESLYKLFI